MHLIHGNNLGDPVSLARWARGRRFDVAIGHGSNDVSVAAALLRVPSATAFDYEWAAAQHQVNCRLARVVMVPDAIPPERLARYGARGKIAAYEGLKEEYYLADFEPDPAVLEDLSLDPAQPIAVVRTPPAVSPTSVIRPSSVRSTVARLPAVSAVRAGASAANGLAVDSWMCAISGRAKQFGMIEYFQD